MLSTGVFYSEDCLKHETGLKHPERAARLTRVMSELLRSDPLLRRNVKVLSPPSASLSFARKVHSNEYVERVVSTCRKGGYVAPDTPVCEGTLEATLAAIGAALTAAKYVAKGEVENAFCLIRPPGHHAGRTRGGGFCVFNNIAILSKYLAEELSAKRILVLDWDVHHGNGTQELFYEEPSVLYFSIHQGEATLYPYTGFIEEVGAKGGAGFNVNVPLPPAAGDHEVLKVINEVFEPIAIQFKPDWILVSAGFDAHHADPLGGLMLTVNCYHEVAEKTRRKAEELCGGKLIALLEGGYNLKYLPQCVLNTVAALADLPALYLEGAIPSSVKARKRVEYQIKRLKRVLSPYWKL